MPFALIRGRTKLEQLQYAL